MKLEIYNSAGAMSHHPSKTQMLSMQGISKNFPGVQALRDVDYSCTTGEVHALVGENGAGKSTLAKILTGVHAPTKGNIWIAGKKRTFSSPNDAQRIGIRIVHQEFSLVPNLPVAENLFLGSEAEYTGRRFWFKSKQLQEKGREILRNLGLKFDPHIIVNRLSVAEQKWIEMAKALVQVPKILVLDEPTAPFSDHEVDHFLGIVRRLKDSGTTIIYISHRMNEIFRIADRVTVLKDGQFVGTRRVGEITKDALIGMMIGRELGEMFPPKREKKFRKKILEIQNLTAAPMIRDVTLDTYEGEILGIGGLQGNGQDQLLKALLGFLSKQRGEIRMEGKRVRIRSPREAIKHGIALVTDKKAEEGLCMDLSIRHNMALPTLKERQVFGVIKMAKELEKTGGMARELALQRPDSLKRNVDTLSGGNKQKVIVGKWLIAEPKVIMIIEPTMGIDVAAKQQLYALLRNLADKKGKSIILVCSEMIELLGLCDRIAVMRQGKISVVLDGESATEEDIMHAAMEEERQSEANQ